jgi:predicted enzyme related to lactoylglutathione lyase
MPAPLVRYDLITDPDRTVSAVAFYEQLFGRSINADDTAGATIAL